MNNFQITKHYTNNYTKNYCLKILFSRIFSVIVAGSVLQQLHILLDPAIKKIFIEKNQTLIYIILPAG